ncbi:hypothetical protein WR25_16922 isoform D [Diploscapter pachys]|uniref:Ig-like domain-containing protein n=1 Tax=Diploscapter pachys TaxID=2018661 RepID=A0A2A2LJS4_9BILA|nr:hypothetical protein WR25_16922 isoform D [Diploscapter pachys]
MATALGIILLLLIGILSLHAQMPPTVQVKISDMPFQVSNAQHLNQIVWTMLGPTTKETIYCVSESPVSQLRFVCIDCIDRNITDMVNVLNSAQDLTRSAGFPTIVLRNIVVNTNWTGATIMCQATLQGQIVDSAPATVDVRYLKQPHVVDENGQGPVLISNQGYRFYVECVRGPDNLCQQSGRRKTLRCAVQAHPDANNFRWLKNGVITSGNGAEITIGTEMIGQSIQCQANNNLLSDQEMQTSEAVQIDPYSSAHLSGDNFAQLQSIPPFQAGNRIEMNQQVKMTCNVDGNPRPVVFWRLRRSNGQVEDAACPQGFEGQYTEMGGGLGLPYRNPNAVHLTASCTLKIQNYSYSGQYWCSACSYVSQGAPECSPPLDSPGQSTLNIQVIGTPMQSDTPTTIEQVRDPPDSRHNSAVVTVHYCAEPMPRPPREVVFIIDQNDLQVSFFFEILKGDFDARTISINQLAARKTTSGSCTLYNFPLFVLVAILDDFTLFVKLTKYFDQTQSSTLFVSTKLFFEGFILELTFQTENVHPTNNAVCIFRSVSNGRISNSKEQLKTTRCRIATWPD